MKPHSFETNELHYPQKVFGLANIVPIKFLDAVIKSSNVFRN